MTKRRILSWVLAGVATVGLTLVLYFMSENKEISWVNVTSVVGVWLTVIGLIITVDQLFELKSRTEIIEKAVDETKLKLSHNEQIAVLSTNIEKAKRIKICINNNSFDLADYILEEFIQSLNIIAASELKNNHLFVNNLTNLRKINESINGELRKLDNTNNLLTLIEGLKREMVIANENLKRKIS